MTNATTHEFDTTQFEWAHGTKPRGRGNWWFSPKTENEDQMVVVVPAPPNLTLTEAKRWVRQNCERGVWRVQS